MTETPPAAGAGAVSAQAPPPVEDTAGPSLGARLRSPTTALSLLASLAIVALALWRAPINWSDAVAEIRRADLRFYLTAIGVYYVSFVIRGARWQLLLANAGERRAAAPLTAIVLASYFVNCVVPAKMGDVYRAYLVRRRERVPATRALGTIIAERLVDLVVLMALLVVALAVTFHNRVPSSLVPYLVAGSVLAVVGIAAFFVMAKGRGRRILVLLPERAVERYEHFRHGTVHAIGRLHIVVPLTVLVWALEGTRLGLVMESLPSARGVLGPAQFLLVALVAALLTTVPFTPGGIGLVEGGMVFVLVTVSSMPQTTAVSAALLDRSISYGTLLVVGAIAFAATHLHLRRDAGPEAIAT
jgi:uncharacterized protein (TIRG00374 family)